MSAAPYAEPFFQGITERICTEYLVNTLSINMVFGDLTKFGYGYSTQTWLLNLIKKSELSVFEIIIIKKILIKI